MYIPSCIMYVYLLLMMHILHWQLAPVMWVWICLSLSLTYLLTSFCAGTTKLDLVFFIGGRRGTVQAWGGQKGHGNM